MFVEGPTEELTAALTLEDRMLVLFWLPILLSESDFGLVFVCVLTCVRSCNCLGAVPVCSCGLPCDGEQCQGPPSSSQSLMISGSMRGIRRSLVFISFLRSIVSVSVILLCLIGFLGITTTRLSEFVCLILYGLFSIDSGCT